LIRFKFIIMRSLLFTLVLLIATNAFAARPFVTDDARLTTAGSCQLETWVRHYDSSNEFWALPACNFTGNLELTVGGARTKTISGIDTDDYVLQAKTLFRELTTNDYGFGFALGTISHPSTFAGPNLMGNTYAYIPFSFSTLNDRFIYHTNVGWLRDKLTLENRMTYGIGAEIRSTDRLLLIAETYGDNKASPYLQAGGRYSVIPNLFQIDTTVGQQFNGVSSTRWISFGLRFTPNSIF
jgi:hypothetical protein